MKIKKLTNQEQNPVIELNAQERDNRICGTAISVTAPAGHVTFDINGKSEPVTVSVPPLDILEFRARLPLAVPQGAQLLTRFTLEETIVALALWHLEHAPSDVNSIGNSAIVQPSDVMFVEANIRDWVETFNKARRMLSSLQSTQ